MMSCNGNVCSTTGTMYSPQPVEKTDMSQLPYLGLFFVLCAVAVGIVVAAKCFWDMEHPKKKGR